ncbi:hypothetical protein MTP99_017654 [Tenebrio molitor]|nr:hypothetical protein MTP99_017654 [Tenebrio molitor]
MGMAAPTRKFASLASANSGVKTAVCAQLDAQPPRKPKFRSITEFLHSIQECMHACAVRSISVDRTPETGGGGGIRSVGGGNLLNDEHDPNNVTKAASSDQERITGGRWRRR